MFYLHEKQKKTLIFLQNSINLTSFTQPLKSYYSGNILVSYSVHICTRNISSPSQVPLEMAALLLSRQHHSNGMPENQYTIYNRQSDWNKRTEAKSTSLQVLKQFLL